jgi:NADH-quinone oxidoreductase subunit A
LPLGGIIFLAVFVTLFGSALLWLASLLGTRTTDPVKFESYECGIPAQNKGDTKISVKFYLTAILFILFDIEIIFMYPWALTFRDFIASGYGVFSFVAMSVFIAIFLFGLFWEIKSKALEWD